LDEDRNAATLSAWSAWLGCHARALRAIEAQLKLAGLPPLGWYDVLLELDRAGGRLRIGELAERLVVEPYNMTRLLDRLETAGLLRRERAKGDRRGAFAVLSLSGAAIRQSMWPTYRRAILEVIGTRLTNKDSEALATIMTKLERKLGSPSRLNDDDVQPEVERRRRMGKPA
jgi:DNA-binding MarR family transcriptional regulator